MISTITVSGMFVRQSHLNVYDKNHDCWFKEKKTIWYVWHKTKSFKNVCFLVLVYICHITNYLTEKPEKQRKLTIIKKRKESAKMLKKGKISKLKRIHTRNQIKNGKSITLTHK